MENLENLGNLENLENNNNDIERAATHKCCNCNNEFNIDELTEINEEFYCENCKNELFTKCESCGEYVRNDYTYLVDGDYLCEECCGELATYCYFCEEWHYNDNICEATDGQLICSDCLSGDETDYRECEECGAIYNVNNEGIYTADGRCVCGSCAEDNYFYCDSCEQYYNNDEMHETSDGEYICDSCYEDLESEINNTATLHDYGYKPSLKIFKTGTEIDKNLFVGFELETEQGNDAKNRDEMCQILNKEINDNGNNVFLYFKTDGSLNHGIEVVSHAFTHEYFRANESNFEKMLQLLSDNGYKSHDTNTCGLHVHINKKYFGDTKEEQDKNIDKLILFFEYFKEQIKKFSRRNSYNYCNFLADKNNITDKKQICNIEKIKNLKNSYDRYLAVNISNDNTVELRVFRGTLKKLSFFATLEFVFNLVRVIKENSLNKITFSKVVNYKDSKYIKKYCQERDIKYDYDYLHDYSIEYLREKEKIDKEARKISSKYYLLNSKILAIAKKEFVNVQKEIENYIKNEKRPFGVSYRVDRMDKLDFVYQILRVSYLAKDHKIKVKEKSLNIYEELRELSDYMSVQKRYINNTEIANAFKGELEELKSLYSNCINIIEKLRQYYNN